MPAPVTVDLSGSLGYAGDPPVSIDLAASAYAGDPPVSVEMIGTGRILTIPQTISLAGVRNGADLANVVNYDGQVVHYGGEPLTT